MLEVGSDKIWALLVLSELFGLRAVSAQCSQRLARLCKADGPVDVSSSETRFDVNLSILMTICVCMYL